MTSPVDIVNMALSQIGAQTSVQGMNPPIPPNSVAAQTASLLYQQQVDAVFRAAHWNCARYQAPLTLLRSAAGTPSNPSGALPIPPIPWLYEYAYPSDCLKVRFVIPLPNIPGTAVPIMSQVGINFAPAVVTSIPFVPAVDKDDNGKPIRVILTNAPIAQGVYTARVTDPDMWDPSLRNAIIATLGAWFVNPINMAKDLLVQRVGMAVALVKEARISDGNEGITSMDHYPDWLEVRNYGANYCGRNVPSLGYMAGWDGLGMPDGVSY